MILNGKKYCHGCDKDLPVAEFGIWNKAADGLRSRCLKCTRAQAVYWRSDYRDSTLMMQRNDRAALTDAYVSEQLNKTSVNRMLPHQWPSDLVKLKRASLYLNRRIRVLSTMDLPPDNPERKSLLPPPPKYNNCESLTATCYQVVGASLNADVTEKELNQMRLLANTVGKITQLDKNQMEHNKMMGNNVPVHSLQSNEVHAAQEPSVPEFSFEQTQTVHPQIAEKWFDKEYQAMPFEVLHFQQLPDEARISRNAMMVLCGAKTTTSFNCRKKDDNFPKADKHHTYLCSEVREYLKQLGDSNE